ncbi:MAG TPA: hypothetical protein DCY07_08070, partial [Rhodospirillaceae bacterium]|nr:hypothetical protein [Rhodospirillaceae bacterium]
MAQGLETKVQASVGSTVSGFLSAIKAGMQACGSGGNMFASLLNEAETNLPEVEAYDPSAASNAKKNAAQTASAEPDTENYDAPRPSSRQD